MKNLNAREQNFLNSLILESILKRKEIVIQEIEEINSQKKTKGNKKREKVDENLSLHFKALDMINLLS